MDPSIIRPEAVSRIVGRRPLSVELQRQLISLWSRPAPYRIEAVPDPDWRPTSLDEVVEDMSGEVDDDEPRPGAIRGRLGELRGTRVRVWSGASDDTIWSAPEVNWLFRAWHDTLHVLLCAGFDPIGEARVAVRSVAMVEGSAEREIIAAETLGQVRYHVAHGTFPARQRAFVRDCVRFGVERALCRVYH